jgi:hypothetical protein
MADAVALALAHYRATTTTVVSTALIAQSGRKQHSR